MFQVKSKANGYCVEWVGEEGQRNPVPLAYEWDKMDTGPSSPMPTVAVVN